MSGDELGGAKVVVTGASGRIGTEVVRELVRSGAKVVGVDRREGPEMAQGVVTFIRADLATETDLATVFNEVDAVVHLAAIPSPRGAERVVFGNNVLGTYRVLEAAAQGGAKCAVIASSMSALGLVYAPYHLSPLYAPIDEEHILRPCDPYALGKQCDELVGAMFARVFSMAIYAFRFPFTSTMDRIRVRAERNGSDPSDGERELWAYLTVGDGARAVRLGVRAGLESLGGAFEVFNIVAKDALIDCPLAEAIGRFHPSTEIRGSLGTRSCGYVTAKAEEMLGFSAVELR